MVWWLPGSSGTRVPPTSRFYREHYGRPSFMVALWLLPLQPSRLHS